MTVLPVYRWPRHGPTRPSCLPAETPAHCGGTEAAPPTRHPGPTGRRRATRRTDEPESDIKRRCGEKTAVGNPNRLVHETLSAAAVPSRESSSRGVLPAHPTVFPDSKAHVKRIHVPAASECSTAAKFAKGLCTCTHPLANDTAFQYYSTSVRAVPGFTYMPR